MRLLETDTSIQCTGPCPQIGVLVEAVQDTTGDQVNIACVDQGYTGEVGTKVAQEHEISLEVVKLPQAKQGFICCRDAGWWNEPLAGLDGTGA